MTTTSLAYGEQRGEAEGVGHRSSGEGWGRRDTVSQTDEGGAQALVSTPSDDRVRGCVSCDGRGWKLVSRRRVLPVREDVVRLTRRPCPDCCGGSVINAA